LLGHNGAGKTTLMSILTGITLYCEIVLNENVILWEVLLLYLCFIGVTSETEGKVFINGKNIRKHLNNIRNDLGLCPQENMVFPDLNVFEQIEFFGLVRIIIIFVESYSNR